MNELTDEQIAELASDLETLALELRTIVDAAADGAKPVDLEEPIGRLSRMDAMQQQSMTRATREAARARLKQVEAALRRAAAARAEPDAVQRGDAAYGWCMECEEPIGYPRLKARPEAVLCIACQSGREESG